jgi:hypothetical protein
MKVVMLECEAGIADAIEEKHDLIIYDVADLPDEEEGDILIWRMNEGRWKELEPKMKYLRRRFKKLILLNTRGYLSLHIGGLKILHFFKQLPKFFDEVWVYEDHMATLFCQWMGFKPEEIKNIPLLVRKDIFDMYKEFKEDERGPRVAFGIYGAAPIRHFNLTAIIGDFLLGGRKDVPRVVFSVNKRFNEGTIAWCKDNVQLYERLPQDVYLDELMSMRFCVYALIGRFAAQAQAVGVPVFGGYLNDRGYDNTIARHYHVRQSDLFTGAQKTKAKILLEDDGYRIEQGKIVREHAIEYLHPTGYYGKWLAENYIKVD